MRPNALSPYIVFEEMLAPVLAGLASCGVSFATAIATGLLSMVCNQTVRRAGRGLKIATKSNCVIPITIWGGTGQVELQNRVLRFNSGRGLY